MIHRRNLLIGLGSLLAAPAIVHAGNLMPIKSEIQPVWLGDLFYSPNTDFYWMAAQNGRDIRASQYWYVVSAKEHIEGISGKYVHTKLPSLWLDLYKNGVRPSDYFNLVNRPLTKVNIQCQS